MRQNEHFEHVNSVETECHVLKKVGKYTIGVHKIEGAPKGQSMKVTFTIMKSMRRQTGKYAFCRDEKLVFHDSNFIDNENLKSHHGK